VAALPVDGEVSDGELGAWQLGKKYRPPWRRVAALGEVMKRWKSDG